MTRDLSLSDRLQTHPLLLVVVPMIIGIVAGDGLKEWVTVWMWAAMMAVGLIAFLIAGRWRPFAQSFVLFLTLTAFGGAIITRCEERVAFPFAESPYADYEAVVVSQPRARGRVLQCDLCITAVDGKRLHNPFLAKASVLRDTVDNRWRQIAMGTGLKAHSQLRPVDQASTWGNFNYTRYLQVHGFSAQTFIFYNQWTTATVSLANVPKMRRIALRAQLTRAAVIAKYLPFHREKDMLTDDRQEEAIVAAMVLGDKQGLSKTTKDVYAVSGASHVLALSGLHLSIIYAMLTLLLGWWRRRWWCQSLVLVAVWGYVVLVGMGASVVRSAVMLTLYSLGSLAHRDRVPVNTLAFAAICLLVVNPLSLWDVGFQMSFTAVLAILLFYPPIYHALPLHNPLLKALWGMAAVSIAAQLGTAPLVAYYFGRFSCWFLLTNFIVVPAATVIIYGTAIMLLLTPLPYFSSISSEFLYRVVKLLNTSLSHIASLPFASVEGIRLSIVHVVLIYIVIASSAIVIERASRTRELRKLDAFMKAEEKG